MSAKHPVIAVTDPGSAAFAGFVVNARMSPISLPPKRIS